MKEMIFYFSHVRKVSVYVQLNRAVKEKTVRFCDACYYSFLMKQQKKKISQDGFFSGLFFLVEKISKLQSHRLITYRCAGEPLALNPRRASRALSVGV